MAALPQAASGSSRSVPAARAAARSAAISGSASGTSGPAPEVRASRVGQVAERQGPTDDRDRVARLQARSRGSDRDRGGRGAAGIGRRRRSVDGVRSRASTSASRSGSPTSMALPTRRSRPVGSSPDRSVLRIEARRGIEPRAAREDADGTRRVADAEPDRPLLVRSPWPDSPSPSRSIERAVVDAADTLERGDEHDFGGFDDTGQADLAGREGADRGRAGVGDAIGGPVADEAALEQDEPGDGRRARRAPRSGG